MVTVSVEALRVGLADYLAKVQHGETVLVVADDVVVARLTPPSTPAPVAADHPFARLIEAGLATPALLPKAGWTWRPRSLNLPRGTAATLLEEVRKDSTEP
jgi:antitoxin (DNA-binding transcriptional repressor) of toxin-antitoxin stability system